MACAKGWATPRSAEARTEEAAMTTFLRESESLIKFWNDLTYALTAGYFSPGASPTTLEGAWSKNMAMAVSKLTSLMPSPSEVLAKSKSLCRALCSKGVQLALSLL